MAIPEYVLYATRIKTFEYPSNYSKIMGRAAYINSCYGFELSKKDYDYMLKTIRNKFLKFVKKLKLNKINPFFVKQNMIKKIFYPKTGKKKNKKMFHCSDGSFFFFFDFVNKKKGIYIIIFKNNNCYEKRNNKT